MASSLIPKLPQNFSQKPPQHVIWLRYSHSREPIIVATIKEEKDNPRQKTINFFVTDKNMRKAKFSQIFIEKILSIPEHDGWLGGGVPKGAGTRFVDYDKGLKLYTVVGTKDRFGFLHPYWK